MLEILLKHINFFFQKFSRIYTSDLNLKKLYIPLCLFHIPQELQDSYFFASLMVIK